MFKYLVERIGRTRGAAAAHTSASNAYLARLPVQLQELHQALCEVGEEHPELAHHPFYAEVTATASPRYRNEPSNPVSAGLKHETACAQMADFLNYCQHYKKAGSLFPDQEKLANLLAPVYDEHCKPSRGPVNYKPG